MLPADLLTYARQHGYTHIRYAGEAVLFLYRPAVSDPNHWGEQMVLHRPGYLYLEAPTILVDALPADAQPLGNP